ncbi:hypothetical protein BGX21_004428, partial [Mortierella sp. AD011]
KRHLRQLAPRKRVRLNEPQETAEIFPSQSSQGDIVAVEDVELGHNLKEWQDILDEPDSDGGSDDETDEEDWTSLKKCSVTGWEDMQSIFCL